MLPTKVELIVTFADGMKKTAITTTYNGVGSPSLYNEWTYALHKMFDRLLSMRAHHLYGDEWRKKLAELKGGL